mgnify:CR=1 FL=1
MNTLRTLIVAAAALLAASAVHAQPKALPMAEEDDIVE